MKSKILLVLFLSSIFMQAQKISLEELSSGSMFYKKALKDKNDNIQGYLTLYNLHNGKKKSKENLINSDFLTLEYVILDENMQKVSSGKFRERKGNTSDKKFKIYVDSELVNDQILISFYERYLLSSTYYTETSATKYYRRYRTIDLKTNELSKSFFFRRDSLETTKWSRTEKEWEHLCPGFESFLGENFTVSEKIFYPKVYTNNKHTANLSNVTYFKKYDIDKKHIWTHHYNHKTDIKEKIKLKNWRSLTPYKENEEIMLCLSNNYKELRRIKNHTKSIYVIDNKTGKLKFEYFLYDYQNLGSDGFVIKNIILKNEKIYIVGKSDFKKNNGSRLVYYKIVLDQNTGEEISKHEFMGKQYKSKKKYGNLHLHNMIITENNHTLISLEDIDYNGSVYKKGNLLFFDLDENFKMFTKKLISKERAMMSGSKEKDFYHYMNTGVDYDGYQKISPNEYLFFWYNNDKLKEVNDWKYHILHYKNGAFKESNIDLENEESYLLPIGRKKGQILFLEEFLDKEKPSEFRFEKINL